MKKLTIFLLGTLLMFSSSAQAQKKNFALAVHGGAGTIDKSLPDSIRNNYLNGLTEALKLGEQLLKEGKPALDVVEKVVNMLEDNPLFNAGKGAVFTAKGENELDASIMDGKTLLCGAVAGVKRIKNPVSLARLVMEKTPHVLLAGQGAEDFATEMNIEWVDPSYFYTETRFQQLKAMQKRLKNQNSSKPADDEKKGTVGCVALDINGNLAAATSTGGMTNKRMGRIGDSPIIGAGTYANNETCAISSTGTGEQFIRYAVAYDISAQMKYLGLSLQKSAENTIFGKLKMGDGGIIGVDKDGNIAFVFNSTGMFRGAADSNGRFEVKIWE